MEALSTLGVDWLRLRDSEPADPASFAFQSDACSLDFQLDDRSLYALLGLDTHFEHCGVLDKREPELSLTTVRRLLLEEPPELGDRHIVYLQNCRCGVDCGVLTVEIRREHGRYVWEHFVQEKGEGDAVLRLESYRDVGPFAFDEAQYGAALRRAAEMIRRAQGREVLR